MNRPSRRRACVRCGELKVRCTLPENGSTCSRCARLGQRCILAAIPQPQAKVVKKDRIDLLQEQIDKLAAQLKEKNLEHETLAPDASEWLPEYIQKAQQRPHINPGLKIYWQEPISFPDDVIARGVLTIDAAEKLLSKFREFKMPLFPFVVLSPAMDLAYLRHHYPFLLLTIFSSSAQDDIPLQRILEKEVRTVICNRLVMADERTMDLLLGLLIHIAWQHYHFQTVRRQVYMTLQMAISIVVDLGLDRDYNFGLRDIAVEIQDQEDESSSMHYTLIEKRALLGCYYLYSVSSIFRKQLFMRHTEWIDRCCEDLSARPEYPSDVHLKTFIDIQLLSRRSEELISSQDAVFNDASTGEAWKIQFKLLEEESKRILERGTKDGLKIPPTLSRDLQTIPIYLNRPFVHRKSPSLALSPANQIIQDLFSCAVSCITSACDLPPSVFIHLPQTSHTMVWYSLLLATKVALCSANSGGSRGEPKIVYDLAVANDAVHGSLSTGDDVWAISQNAIGFVITWLETYESQGLQRQTGLPRQRNTNTTHLRPIGGIPNSRHDPLPRNYPHAGVISQYQLPTIQLSEAAEPLDDQMAFDIMKWDEMVRDMMLDDFTIMPTTGFPMSDMQWPRD